MSGLMSSLSLAARALDAQRAGLAVTGNNIANLNTDGYVRRAIQLVEGQPGAGGVDVLGTRARRDLLLDARVRQELPAESRERALAESLAVVEASLGGEGTSLDGQLVKFFDAFSALSQDATSTVARDGVLQQGRLLARSFNDLASRLDDSRMGTDAAIRGGINDLNRLADQVASLNQSINATNAGDAEGLRDQQAEALKAMALLADISVLQRSDGGVDVALGEGRALVMGTTSYRLQAVDTPPSGVAAIHLGATDITAEFDRGKIGGWLEVRDTRIPAYGARLDQMAFVVAGEVNSLHQGGTDLLGGTGNDFFAPIGAAAGAARAITMNAVVDADPQRVAASQSTAPGGNLVAKSIADLRDARVVGGAATLAESWAQLVYHVAGDSQTAQAQQQSRQQVVDQVTRLRDQVSGVSLDEEAALMMRFQRAYEANARYFSAVDNMLATLMHIVGAG